MYVFYGDVWIFSSLTVIFTSILLYMRYLARNDDYWKKRGVPYYPRQSIWYILKLIRDKPISEITLQNYKKYGSAHGTFEFSNPSFVVSDNELLRDVLVKDFHVFSFRRDLKVGIDLMDKMVSVLKGDDWKRVRTIITPAFTSKRMRQMGSIINQCSNTVIQTFDKNCQAGKPVDCKSIFGAFTMDVIASAAFATKIDSLNDPDNIFAKKVKQIFQGASAIRLLLFMLLPLKFATIMGKSTFDVMDFFKKIIMEVIQERKQSQKRYNDVLQILMDAMDDDVNQNVKEEHKELLDDEVDQFGTIINDKITNVKYKTLSEDEVLAQSVLFFFVGYETSAATMAYLAYCLALNPEWQDKLILEVDAAFEKHSEMSYDAVRDMKVLDCILSETLRMFPPLLASERTATEDYKLGNTGITLEKGMRVTFPIYAMHYDPEYFDEPNTFNPERFMNPTHPAYTYLPFGAGPRNCLGMRFAILEIKLCMANILRHYRFRRAPNTQVPLPYKKGSGFLSVDELPLNLEKRTDIIL